MSSLTIYVLCVVRGGRTTQAKPSGSGRSYLLQQREVAHSALLMADLTLTKFPRNAPMLSAEVAPVAGPRCNQCRKWDTAGRRYELRRESERMGERRRPFLDQHVVEYRPPVTRE